MNNLKKISGSIVVLYCCFLTICVETAFAAPVDRESFEDFLVSFYTTAAEKGITRSTYDRAFASVTAPDPVVLQKAAYQSEFITKIWDYLDARITVAIIDDGFIMSGVYAKLLQQIEAKFGVEAEVILAIWSMESSYGAALLQQSRLHYVPRALATLAYADKRRQKFGRTQLVAALQIVQAGDVNLEQLTGSWAGAMGHTQFIPTSFLAYGVDMDGSGRRDIWNSIPDALSTAANLLHSNKWRTGKPWGYEVKVPVKGAGHAGETKMLKEWQQLGFVRPDGASFSDLTEKAELKMIGGAKGPGFLMLRNFFILKRYNNSDFYALAVGLLADRLAGRKGMVQSWPRPAGSLSVDDKFELQKLLQEEGHYSDAVDGFIGKNTIKGIEDFQAANGLAVDGKVSQGILKALRRKE